MIDFNAAETQGAGGNGQGPIPEDSIIAFKMTIRPPKAGKEGTLHALYCRSGKGNEYLDCEFEALGTYAGRKIWQNFTLAGSEQAAKISMRTLRAIWESAKNISPSDASPQATAARTISDWPDMIDITFLAKVGCKVEQSQKDGQWYINNEIKRVITPDDPEYATGEFISDKPLPPIPAPGETTSAPKPAAAGASAWGSNPAPAQTATPPTIPPTTPPNKPSGPVPSWAVR